MLTLEAEIDVNGKVTLLEPVRINKRSRAILTVLDVGSGDANEAGKEDEMAAERNFAGWIGSVNSGDQDSSNNE